MEGCVTLMAIAFWKTSHICRGGCSEAKESVRMSVCYDWNRALSTLHRHSIDADAVDFDHSIICFLFLHYICATQLLGPVTL
jgi:hypothetical protein